MDGAEQTGWLFGGLAADKAAADQRITPMMSQFFEIKAANPDCLLFYRMGDFYELFFEDAETASRALGITLTKRGKHLGEEIPMCGVPIHSADDYLERLIRLGHRVAVCEQTEDPAEARKRGAKSVVRREVIRLVTPGTLTEDSLLDARKHNFLASLVRQKQTIGMAWLDISTGDFRFAEIREDGLPAELARIEPTEILLPEHVLADERIAAPLRESGASITPLPGLRFDPTSAARRLCDHFKILAPDAFGLVGNAEIAAAGALLEYVSITQVGRLPELQRPRKDDPASAMSIDPATRASLELVRTLAGNRNGSLLDTIDATVTGAGARLLAERLAAPSTDIDVIGNRLDSVQHLIERRSLRKSLRELLRYNPDIARSIARLSLGRGGPRDIAAIMAGLRVTRKILGEFAKAQSTESPNCFSDALAALADQNFELCDDFNQAFCENLPLMARDGGFVRTGYRKDLDELKELSDNSRRVIASLQANYVSETGFKSLKIKHNNVLGYFVELPQAIGEELVKQPQSKFIHRQTMANAMRFTTAELAEIESRLSAAGEQSLAIEMEVFGDFVTRALAESARLMKLVDALSEIDVAAALAEIAELHQYVRPKVDTSGSFKIDGGRHPVVEQALLASNSGSFIANDCDLSSPGYPLWLVTGPNMAGKSTFLRQNAVIAIMAQMGSFVPARSAHIGIVDRLFSRVGAADDLARGRSTFMVEMVEAAAILNQAGPRALVILDEIGRGTATFDGLSIAWACVEHLHEVNRCRALFATHFHELTELAERLPGLRNVSMKVKEWQGQVIFLHEVGDGAADRSYGIQVAQLAGLPPSVIGRARDVMSALEARSRDTSEGYLSAALPDFDAFASRSQGIHPALQKLDEVQPDDLSPRDALELIYLLKRMR